jgi:aspartyl protease family protein
MIGTFVASNGVCVLARLVVLVAVLSILAIFAPSLAPGLLSAVLHADGSGASVAPVAPVPAPARLPALSSSDENGGGLRRVALGANSAGHYLAKATINGRPVTLMVDTGATTVALTDTTARRLGIYVARNAYRENLSTANGVVQAAPVNLDEVRLGNVALRDVTAVVVPGSALPVDLLGMSFLSRLSKFEIARGQLVLSQ